MNTPLARLCATLAITLILPAPGFANTLLAEADLQISRAGDIEKTCGELSEEAMLMRDVIYTMEDIKSTSEIRSHGVTAAGAIGSLLIGSATGGIGLAAAGFLLDYNISETEEDADKLQDAAAQRRTLMMGIYNAKGCFGPVEHAMQNPEEFDTLDKIAEIAPNAGEEKYQASLQRRYND